jgi:putative tricarboxylic transport membrane protein
MGVDNSNALLVPKGSEFNTIEQFMEYAKANPEKINLGGGNIGSTDSVLTQILEDNAGVKFNFIPFAGGGEVVTAALGGHVDAMWGNIAETKKYVDSGDFKMLATISTERLSITPDIPTFIEKGYKDVDYTMFRGIAAPGGISAAATKYWEDLCKQSRLVLLALSPQELADKTMGVIGLGRIDHKRPGLPRLLA